MIEQFYPDVIIESTYEINYEKLYKSGIQGLIFDIDNTLVPHGAPADERSKDLFRRLDQIGFSCCLLSNNHESRVNLFNRDIGVYQICDAHKPSTKGYSRAMKIMGTNLSSTLLIGDQLFTDIWGANRTGMANILVRPVDLSWEPPEVVFKRKLEKIVFHFYDKREGRQ